MDKVRSRHKRKMDMEIYLNNLESAQIISKIELSL